MAFPSRVRMEMVSLVRTRRNDFPKEGLKRPIALFCWVSWWFSTFSETLEAENSENPLFEGVTPVFFRGWDDCPGAPALPPLRGFAAPFFRSGLPRRSPTPSARWPHSPQAAPQSRLGETDPRQGLTGYRVLAGLGCREGVVTGEQLQCAGLGPSTGSCAGEGVQVKGVARGQAGIEGTGWRSPAAGPAEEAVRSSCSPPPRRVVSQTDASRQPWKTGGVGSGNGRI